MSLPEILYHYCPPDAFLSILQSRRLRLTHISYFEDQQEWLWFLNIVKGRIDARDAEWHAEHGRFLNAEFELSVDPPHSVYCACLSTEGDMLSQWKAYADGGRGFAIGFNRDALDQLLIEGSLFGVALEPVEYDREKHVEAADSILDFLSSCPLGDDLNRQIQARAAWGDVWSRAAVCKNPLFRTEQEARLIYGGPVPDLKFCMRRNQVLPYIEAIFPKDESDRLVIQEVVFGPRVARPDLNQHAIMELLARATRDVYIPAPRFSQSDLKLS